MFTFLADDRVQLPLQKILTFLGGRHHQCDRCHCAWARSAWPALRVRETANAAFWPYCCLPEEIVQVEEKTCPSWAPNIYRVALVWDFSGETIGGCHISLDPWESDHSNAARAFDTVVDRLRAKIRHQRLAATLRRSGVLPSLSEILVSRFKGQIRVQFVWKNRKLCALTTFEPPEQWARFKRQFQIDTKQTTWSSCCAVCLQLPALPEQLVLCHLCGNGPLCGDCYSLDVPACTFCVDSGTDPNSCGLRLRRYWFMGFPTR